MAHCPPFTVACQSIAEKRKARLRLCHHLDFRAEIGFQFDFPKLVTVWVSFTWMQSLQKDGYGKQAHLCYTIFCLPSSSRVCFLKKLLHSTSSLCTACYSCAGRPAAPVFPKSIYRRRFFDKPLKSLVPPLESLHLAEAVRGKTIGGSNRERASQSRLALFHGGLVGHMRIERVLACDESDVLFLWDRAAHSRSIAC